MSLAGDEIALAQAQAVRPLLLALEVAARGELHAGEAVRLLGSPLGGLDPAALRQAVRQWRRAHPGCAMPWARYRRRRRRWRPR